MVDETMWPVRGAAKAVRACAPLHNLANCVSVSCHPCTRAAAALLHPLPASRVPCRQIAGRSRKGGLPCSDAIEEIAAREEAAQPGERLSQFLRRTPHSARKNIPRAKARVNRVNRHADTRLVTPILAVTVTGRPVPRSRTGSCRRAALPNPELDPNRCCDERHHCGQNPCGATGITGGNGHRECRCHGCYPAIARRYCF